MASSTSAIRAESRWPRRVPLIRSLAIVRICWAWTFESLGKPDFPARSNTSKESSRTGWVNVWGRSTSPPACRHRHTPAPPARAGPGAPAPRPTAGRPAGLATGPAGLASLKYFAPVRACDSFCKSGVISKKTPLFALQSTFFVIFMPHKLQIPHYFFDFKRFLARERLHPNLSGCRNCHRPAARV